MIKTKPVRGKKLVSATFRHEADKGVGSVELLGDFNEWSLGSHPMKRRKDGSFSITVRLPRKERFQFRYLVDGESWLTDEESGGVALNEFGGFNAVLET